MRLTIDTDEAVELDIYCKRGRTFDLELDLKKPLTGDYKLKAVSTNQESFALAIGSGITIAGQSLVLQRSHEDMATLATGIYQYELVELINNRADNLMTGKIFVKPSVLDLSQ